MPRSLGAVLSGAVASAAESLPRDPTLSPSDLVWLSRPPENCTLGPAPEPPPPPPPPPGPRLELEGLIGLPDGARLLIIGGEVYRPGGRVQRARVLSVGSRCVRFLYRKLRRCFPP